VCVCMCVCRVCVSMSLLYVKRSEFSGGPQGVGGGWSERGGFQ